MAWKIYIVIDGIDEKKANEIAACYGDNASLDIIDWGYEEIE